MLPASVPNIPLRHLLLLTFRILKRISVRPLVLVLYYRSSYLLPQKVSEAPLANCIVILSHCRLCPLFGKQSILQIFCKSHRVTFYLLRSTKYNKPHVLYLYQDFRILHLQQRIGVKNAPYAGSVYPSSARKKMTANGL